MAQLVGDDEAAKGVDFFEVAPENWIDVGGRYGRLFRALTERFPFVCHGLSLSLGGPTPLDRSLLEAVKQFLERPRHHLLHRAPLGVHGSWPPP